MKPVIIRPRAEADIEDAFNWYEAERAGLGQEFRAALRSALAALAEGPQRYPVVFRGARRIRLKRFPYSVYYREFADVIAVLACTHGHRHPSQWQSRI